MEKLIELLNEHRVKLCHGNIQNQTMWHYNGYVFGLGDLNSQNCILLIISKEYGFIKWLVDNDKIDDKKLYSNDYRLMIKLEGESYGELGGADRLIMILSVKENPIEYLVSILK